MSWKLICWPEKWVWSPTYRFIKSLCECVFQFTVNTLRDQITKVYWACALQHVGYSWKGTWERASGTPVSEQGEEKLLSSLSQERQGAAKGMIWKLGMGMCGLFTSKQKPRGILTPKGPGQHYMHSSEAHIFDFLKSL